MVNKTQQKMRFKTQDWQERGPLDPGAQIPSDFQTRKPKFLDFFKAISVLYAIVSALFLVFKGSFFYRYYQLKSWVYNFRHQNLRFKFGILGFGGGVILTTSGSNSSFYGLFPKSCYVVIYALSPEGRCPSTLTLGSNRLLFTIIMSWDKENWCSKN